MAAALERMFNVEVTEPEEVQKLRLTELSKEDLIEQYLKIKVSTGWLSFGALASLMFW